MNLIDKFGRKHDYLRISITDRCNLRCVYCMGEEGIKLLDHEDILSYEEITQLVKIMAPWGLKKLRITGGEPLVRKGVESLIGNLFDISGIEEISLTTNGILLAPMVDRLMENGLKRINISLDSLRPDIYKKVTRWGNLSAVLDGISMSLKKGLTPIKINVVLMAGVNDTEIYDFIKMTLDNPIHIRFIEYMPLDDHDNAWANRYVPLQTVMDKINSLGFKVVPAEGLVGNGTAETWRILGAKGTIGLIHPVSNHFCGTCSRLRLTADGKFKPCLFWQEEINIREAIKNPLELEKLINYGLSTKHEKHLMSKDLTRNHSTVRSMAQIGG